MNIQRVHAVLSAPQKTEVFYNERPVWIQEVHDDIAKISFIDSFEEKDVYIDDLYEEGLYS